MARATCLLLFPPSRADGARPTEISRHCRHARPEWPATQLSAAVAVAVAHPSRPCSRRVSVSTMKTTRRSPAKNRRVHYPAVSLRAGGWRLLRRTGPDRSTKSL